MMLERSRALIKENCRVRGIGVAVVVKVSIFTFSYRSFFLTDILSFCSPSMISKSRSLKRMSLPTIR